MLYNLRNQNIGRRAVAEGSRVESIKVQGKDLVHEVRRLIHEGNVRRLTVKHEGHVVVEIPVTAAAIAVVLAPVLAAVGALAAVITECTIDVERGSDAAKPGSE